MVNPIVAAAPLGLFLLAGATSTGERAPPRPLQGLEVAQVRIREHIVIRVPRVVGTVRAMRTSPPPEPNWKEKKADKCIPMTQLAGYAVTRGDNVDLLLNGSGRLRIKLDHDCPALDYYSGFYIRRNPDGMICAKRDTIRSRSGGECSIKGFRRLIPQPPRR